MIIRKHHYVSRYSNKYNNYVGQVILQRLLIVKSVRRIYKVTSDILLVKEIHQNSHHEFDKTDFLKTVIWLVIPTWLVGFLANNHASCMDLLRQFQKGGENFGLENGFVALGLKYVK
ncbi:hypothetical protein HanRHA438_Chr17g0804101 [Helianthus annuus]|nr:hypothetical protein HanRHA438_Chr17g0804101 [Helianthus annuus]